MQHLTDLFALIWRNLRDRLRRRGDAGKPAFLIVRPV
jgi:hypothetical protein